MTSREAKRGGRTRTAGLTLNLCLVHHKVVVVATALVLLPSAALQTLVLVLHVVQREEGRGQPAAAALASQDRQRLLLRWSAHVLKPTRTTEGRKERDAPTCCVQTSTHRSTDMFWITWVKGSARSMLSGRWKQPLSRALPSETQQDMKNVLMKVFFDLCLVPIQLYFPGYSKKKKLVRHPTCLLQRSTPGFLLAACGKSRSCQVAARTVLLPTKYGVDSSYRPSPLGGATFRFLGSSWMRLPGFWTRASFLSDTSLQLPSEKLWTGPDCVPPHYLSPPRPKCCSLSQRGDDL